MKNELVFSSNTWILTVWRKIPLKMAVDSRDKFIKRAVRMIAPSIINRKMWGYRYKNRAKKLIATGIAAKFPESLNLSLSTICQAKCIYCPSERGKGIKPPFMPFQLAKKVVDEASEENFQGIVRFSENGEALLNKDFFSIFEYCRKMLPASRFVLYTNMTDDCFSEALCEAATCLARITHTSGIIPQAVLSSIAMTKVSRGSSAALSMTTLPLPTMRRPPFQ